jgi:putative flippase GtrA
MRVFLSFLIVGAAGSAAYVLLSTFLNEMFDNRALASFTAYASLVPIMYFSQRRLTFASTASHRVAFPKYVATQSIGLALSVALPEVLQYWILPAFVSFIAVAGVIAITNFSLLKCWTFANY